VSPRLRLRHRERRDPEHPFTTRPWFFTRRASTRASDVSSLDRVREDLPARVRPRASDSTRRPNRFRDPSHTIGGACDRRLPPTTVETGTHNLDIQSSDEATIRGKKRPFGCLFRPRPPSWSEESDARRASRHPMRFRVGTSSHLSMRSSRASDPPMPRSSVVFSNAIARPTLLTPRRRSIDAPRAVHGTCSSRRFVRPRPPPPRTP
jgi:hypothetical protein